MLKSELISELKQIEGDLEILLSADDEGNSFRRLTEIAVDKYHEDGHEIDVLHPDDVEEYEEDGEPLPEGIVLW